MSFTITIIILASISLFTVAISASAVILIFYIQRKKVSKKDLQNNKEADKKTD